MNKVTVIAEIGVNHDGDVRKAKQLVMGAKLAGADIVKFQTFSANSLASISAATAKYQKASTKAGSQHELLANLELTRQEFTELKEFCDYSRIEFLSTAFDLDSLEFLLSLGMERIKVPSGEITNTPLLNRIAAEKKHIILSTGMSSEDEIAYALDILSRNGTERKKITVLHCTTNYPAQLNELNLRALSLLASKTGLEIGYSDHSLGSMASIIAISLGASIIEKHITLNNNASGPDHKASMQIDEFTRFVEIIRETEIALGEEVKAPTLSEIENRQLVRKSIYTTKIVRKGEIFDTTNLTTKRPADGLSPLYWNELIGRASKRFYSADERVDKNEI